MKCLDYTKISNNPILQISTWCLSLEAMVSEELVVCGSWTAWIERRISKFIISNLSEILEILNFPSD